MTTAKRGTKKKAWSRSVGERGQNRVRVYEDGKSGSLFVEYHERVPGCDKLRRRRKAFGRRDKQEALKAAYALAADFAELTTRPTAEPTLGELFDIYLGEVTPTKGESKQGHDRRTAAMFVEAFGRGFKAQAFSRREWDRFIHRRRSGEIAPSGSRGRKVGNRTIAYDLKFLVSVFNWALTAGDGQGGRLLLTNPVAGLKIPREESPRRVRLEEGQYLALLAVAPQVDWRFELALVLAHETGARIASIRRLRWTDIDLREQEVRWRKENDKIGFERTTPLTPQAVEALQKAQRVKPTVGGTWVFPAPRDASSSCRGDLMTKWWNRAVKLAGLPPKERRGWHSLRRKFATDLKGVATADLLKLGGWKSVQTLTKCYQGADESSMRAALGNRRRQVS